MQLSQGEKLILLMLCEIQEHLKINGSTDQKVISEAIHSGNLWSLNDNSLIATKNRTPEEVEETIDILNMWQRLEESFTQLSDENKKLLEEEAAPFGNHVRFEGFDGNNEHPFINIASFHIETLGRFKYFKGRNLDAHMPTIQTHRRMLAVFSPILRQVGGGNLDTNQLTQVMKARLHAES